MLLRSGTHELRIEAVHARRAYMGVLGGESRASINGGVLKRAPRRARELFACDGVHLVDPTRDWDNFGRASNSLPNWEIYALLKCDWAPTEEYDGSQVVVIFYADHLFESGVLEQLSTHLERSEWESIAEPYLIIECEHYGGTMLGPRES
jgi:hypothetical protein